MSFLSRNWSSIDETNFSDLIAETSHGQVVPQVEALKIKNCIHYSQFEENICSKLDIISSWWCYMTLYTHLVYNWQWLKVWNILCFCSPLVCAPWASGTWGWLEVPGYHSHPGGEEKREGQAPLCQEKDSEQADQASRKERWGQDCKIHRCFETIWSSCLSWWPLANKDE